MEIRIIKVLLYLLLDGCHVWPNTIEHTVDYGKQNGTDFRFIG